MPLPFSAAKSIPVFVLILLLTGCPDQISKVTQPTPLQKFYLDHGWIPLDIPDSKFAPGSIVHLGKNTVEWLSTVKSCGVPDDVIAITQGSSPKLTFDTTASYGANAVLKVAGIEAGPDWKKVKNVTLEQDDHGGDAIDLLKLKIWMTDPQNSAKIPAACTSTFNQPDIYIVRESYRVSKGKYTLHGENGGEIKVTGLQLGPVSISPNANAKATDDGGLEFTQAEYTAIKRLAAANGILVVLGPGQQEVEGDAKVRKALFPNVK